MTARWQDDPERGPRVRGRLAEIRDARIGLDAAEALNLGDLDPWMRRRHETILAGKRKGLDATIGMALYDQAEIPIADIAAAAGVDIAHVEGVRDRLRSFGR